MHPSIHLTILTTFSLPTTVALSLSFSPLATTIQLNHGKIAFFSLRESFSHQHTNTTYYSMKIKHHRSQVCFPRFKESWRGLVEIWKCCSSLRPCAGEKVRSGRGGHRVSGRSVGVELSVATGSLLLSERFPGAKNQC